MYFIVEDWLSPKLLLKFVAVVNFPCRDLNPDLIIAYVNQIVGSDDGTNDKNEAESSDESLADDDSIDDASHMINKLSLVKKDSKTKTKTDALKVLMFFQPVVDITHYMDFLLRQRDWTQAKAMLITYPLEAFRKYFVGKIVELKEFKIAHEFVRKFGLALSFPDVEESYGKYSFEKKLNAGDFERAALLCHSCELQMMLVNKLLEQKHTFLALAYHKKFSLEASLPINQDILQQIEYDYKETYVQLPWSTDDIIFVDSVEKVALARSILATTDVVGLDCEWYNYYPKSPIAIFQISTRDKSIILDCLTLPVNVFNTLLLDLFTNQAITKVGFEFCKEDMKNLRMLKPVGSSCFEKMPIPYIELRDLGSRMVPSWKGAPSSYGKSLSELCRLTIGKIISKVERMSNWENRPLTTSQLTYASVDALATVLVFDFLTKKPKSVSISDADDTS